MSQGQLMFKATTGSTTFDARRYPDPSLFKGLSPDDAARWAAYFYTTPRIPTAAPGLRQRAFALYDPFARRDRFAAGIRYGCNVYAGCPHRCAYCYCRNYVANFDEARPKARLLQQAERDLRDMTRLDLPPAPVHLSNSTDPFQPVLEQRERATLTLLERILAHRTRFSTLTILTKNSQLAARPEYVALLSRLAPCRVEVSLCFADDAHRRRYEPAAPSVRQRMRGIQALCEAGIRVGLRIDPLFPREPLPTRFWPRERLSDYGIQATQTLEELETLVAFGARVGVERVIVSPLKIPLGNRSPSAFPDDFRALYAAPFGGKPRMLGYSMRLPDDYVRDELIGPVVERCAAHNLPCVFCKRNLIETP